MLKHDDFYPGRGLMLFWEKANSPSPRPLPEGEGEAGGGDGLRRREDRLQRRSAPVLGRSNVRVHSALEKCDPAQPVLARCARGRCTLHASWELQKVDRNSSDSLISGHWQKILKRSLQNR